MARKPKERTRSLRAYRRKMDVLLAQAARGEITWTEARAGIVGIREAAQTLLAENLMRAQGVVDLEVTEHPLGEDGGLESYAPHKKAKRAVRTTVTKKAGLSDKGPSSEESTKTQD